MLPFFTEYLVIAILAELITGIAFGTILNFGSMTIHDRENGWRVAAQVGLLITLCGFMAVAPTSLIRIWAHGFTPVIVEIVILWAVFITSTVTTFAVLDYIKLKE